jgi:hypothetical protein
MHPWIFDILAFGILCQIGAGRLIDVERLRRGIQRIRVISSNEAYPNELTQLDEKIDFEILGQVHRMKQGSEKLTLARVLANGASRLLLYPFFGAMAFGIGLGIIHTLLSFALGAAVAVWGLLFGGDYSDLLRWWTYGDWLLWLLLPGAIGGLGYGAYETWNEYNELSHA